MGKYFSNFYDKLEHFKWVIMRLILFFLVFFLTTSLALMPFGLYHQTMIYKTNWQQALDKYVPQHKYYLNSNFSGYQSVVLPQLTNIFNQNCQYLLLGLIATKLNVSLNTAITIKDKELSQLDARLNSIYSLQNDLALIIKSYNSLLQQLFNKYTSFAINNIEWQSANNVKMIKALLSYHYQSEYIFAAELPLLEYGNDSYYWYDDDGNKLYFEGMQTYEYYTYSNYLTVLDALVSGSLSTNDAMLKGQWSTKDLDYLEFLKVKTTTENFYYPKYFQAFIIQRIATIILIILVPIWSMFLLTFFLAWTLEYKLERSKIRRWRKTMPELPFWIWKEWC